MNEKVKVIYRDPTPEEAQAIIEQVKEKMEKENINKTDLAERTGINYPNLISVLNGKLISRPIINKLSEWINE